MPEPLVIWRLTDGKPGHMQQTLGLANAMSRLAPCDCHEIDLREHPTGLPDLLRGRFPAGEGLPRPGLVMGAGHGTHLALLAARRATGARIVALMKPSLPLFLFDVVVVPAHDGVAEGGRVITTLGVLNPMRPGVKRPGTLLVLVGGPSKHVRWDDAAVLEQVEAIAAAQPAGSDWQLSDSRRTPPALSAELRRRLGPRFQSWADCPPGWLAARLAETESVWVSEDSVSMVYESLTAGCRVGLLQLPRTAAPTRVIRGVGQLLADRRVTSFAEWRATRRLPPAQPFDEASRVAARLLGMAAAGA